MEEAPDLLSTAAIPYLPRHVFEPQHGIEASVPPPIWPVCSHSQTEKWTGDATQRKTFCASRKQLVSLCPWSVERPAMADKEDAEHDKAAISGEEAAWPLRERSRHLVETFREKRKQQAVLYLQAESLLLNQESTALTPSPQLSILDHPQPRQPTSSTASVSLMSDVLEARMNDAREPWSPSPSERVS